MTTYYWDFFGPRSAGTAQHFETHLGEFLVRHGLEGCKTGLVSEGPGHHAVYCETPESARAIVETALRPKRSSETSETRESG